MSDQERRDQEMLDIDHEILLSHEYDGIKEYDNPLPTWWVVLFILSVLLFFPYVVFYHFGTGDSVEEAYEKEIAAYAQMLIEKYGELSADRETILAYVDDDVAMTGMSALFRGKCAQCHLVDGGGGVGPNLTDKYWLNVEEVTDIADIIRDGLVVKGMPAWSNQLTETQIVLLSSYVLSLGINPVDGKAPQGERRDSLSADARVPYGSKDNDELVASD